MQHRLSLCVILVALGIAPLALSLGAVSAQESGWQPRTGKSTADKSSGDKPAKSKSAGSEKPASPGAVKAVEGKDKPGGEASDRSPAQPAAVEPATKPGEAPKLAVPDAAKSLLLVRTTLLTLGDAIATGNFTVLRDKAAPSFQAINTAARLGFIFEDLRRQNIELAVAAVITPQLTAPPVISDNGLLRLTGYFPGEPVRINFDLLFQGHQGQWRLFGLSINPGLSATGAAPTEPVTTK